MSESNKAESRSPRRYPSPAFVSLFVQNFLVFCGFNVFNVIPDHLASLGASKTYIGLFMNLPSLALVLLVVPLSRYSDRIGRKKLMLAGYVAALATAGLSFAFARDLVALALLRGLGTFLFCTVFTIQFAEAFEHIPRSRRLSGMAIFGTSGLIAGPVASLIAERLLAGPGAPWIFAAVFAFQAAAALIALPYRFREPGEGAGPRPFLPLLGKKELAPLILMTFMIGGAYAVFSTFLANLTRERLGTVNVSLFFASFSVVAALVRLFLGPYIERGRQRNTAAVGFGLIAASFLLTFFLRSKFTLVPAGLLYGMGHSVLYPLLVTAFVNSGGDEERLALNSLYSAANTLGNIVTAVVLGAFADVLGTASIFLAMAILSALSAPYAYLRPAATEKSV